MKSNSRNNKLKSAKTNIHRLRKFRTIYSRFMLCAQISIICFVYLLFFTNYLSFITNSVERYFYKFSHDIGFKLENISIEGQHNISLAEILDILNINRNVPLFEIDLKDAQNKLQKNSWIKFALLERKLPNSLYIGIVERKPVAIWQVNQKLLLIDNDGYIVSDKNINKFSHLLHVVGKDANIHVSQLIMDLTKYPILMEKIISSVRYGERRWDLNLQQNITIKMPEIGFNTALDYIISLDQAHKLFDQNYKILDLRDSNKFYIEKF